SPKRHSALDRKHPQLRYPRRSHRHAGEGAVRGPDARGHVAPVRARPDAPLKRPPMYYNTFASGSQPTDLTNTEDFGHLLKSAGELELPYREPIRLQARNLVANGHRFHLLEWGNEANPTVLIVHGRSQTGHAWDFASLSLR